MPVAPLAYGQPPRPATELSNTRKPNQYEARTHLCHRHAVGVVIVACELGHRHAFRHRSEWLEELKPDVLLFFNNDHANSIFFDFYSTFAIGISPTFELADEGAGTRPLPPIKSNTNLAICVAESLVNDEFDMTIFQDRPLDHGCHSPLCLLWPHQPDWPGTVVPIEVNVLQHPLPSALRCYKLGQAVVGPCTPIPRT